LDAANSTFEDLTTGYTIGDWTAEDNSTLSVVLEKVVWKSFRHGESQTPGVTPIQPPKGVAALQVVPTVAGDYTAISDYIPVSARQNYLARASNQVVLTNLTTNYDKNATQVAHLEIVWYNAAQGFLSTDIGDELTVAEHGFAGGWTPVWNPNTGNATPPTPAWVRLQCLKRAPSGAAFARVRVSMTAALTFQGQLVDDVLFSRVV
jgi:hypothetical protein